MKKDEKLTSWEWKSLVNPGSLADGHAHQGQNASQRRVINRLSSIFFDAEKANQLQLQNDFEKLFFHLGGQKAYKKFSKPLYHYACSLCIEVVANYLRTNNTSVSLVHPTFDNLADILKRHKVKLEPISESELLDIAQNKHKIRTQALFLVCPNNPTGLELTKKQFSNIVDYCKKNNKLLILDFSFRFFSKHIEWDQYEILHSSGVDFIALEDTGKVWPTLDLKIGLMISNNSLYEDMVSITDDFILNLSPFIIQLLTEYLQVEKIKSRSIKTAQVIKKNKKILIDRLRKTPLRVMNPGSPMSVAWIRLPKTWESTTFCEWLEKNNIYVLPGGPFFWNDAKQGDSFLRIALSRPEKLFSIITKRLEIATLKYKNETPI
ncbi:hypothetical protein A3G67_02260 [Candidatus Roizmanbacteria bacterium RIFCSPLOWO2_12_FULL_40_12]|uniref:Aminotransferase class I/classII large domain-containing protein n=1 Tax=Candidatus Roizmanbacteria bacterium RIFCSPLOWO2_01_FULL_40_42 TaxID=1802066 RepID=A0A1F7J3R4_9BACT|nr:MAG: hypothetical protein A2779_01465 [Candidatus Roizmanbacteria bacterium RIFCSPHIGHO2_01_FULL_40_98]OGK29028.1 MAG: hypothetical protein A3C31_02105 [Candidatus Roizmanbacteria bacterium RIFCSPHIGHO2_02_FULL_40_53]OGK29975.1 MAG: hypothetical protein A2W49_00105 [Candidatus Roizmanbacteria bacterium RIFCSPHIGHO2_12_41_18]OGK37316.1 MAG: hypothetical protein A3E69_04405 [Candidatus Roizmanbacteria bacterium RIFCSPHIGHO2_12_FULL_40_130]OGK50258.1 MAG: hypothetical protein A3B50_00560 [Candi